MVYLSASTAAIVRRYRRPRRATYGSRLRRAAMLAAGVIAAAVAIHVAAQSTPAPGQDQAHDPALATQLHRADAIARQIVITIDDYIERHDRIPASLAEAGFILPTYTSIARVEIQPESGVMFVQIKATDAQTGPAPDEALSLVYARVAGDYDQPVWVCAGGPDVAEALLPAGCRTERTREHEREHERVDDS